MIVPTTPTPIAPLAELEPGAAAPVRVLIADEELSVLNALSMALRTSGFEVRTVESGGQALTQARVWHPNAMILGVSLPDIEGFDVARRLVAEQLQVPILFLSPGHDAFDRVRGLTTGVDDYVTKPFSLEALMARLRHLLRRSGAGADGDQLTSHLAFADLELDDDAHEVTRAGRAIELSATEYRLLRYLMLHPRQALSRAQLLNHVWSYDFNGDARVLETYVSYLRKKLEAHEPLLIHTVRGIGYVLREPRS